MKRPLPRLLWVCALAISLAGCGGDDATAPPAPAQTAPHVSQPPSSRAVAAGSAVTFSVTAVGSAPLAYQWHRNGIPIEGATGASYRLARAELTDDEVRFDVTVGNGAGQVRSAAAVLTVFAPPAASRACTTPGATFEVVHDATVAVGDAAGAVVLGCGGSVTHMHWSGSGGPAPAPLLSARTQAISFEPQAAGTYAFELTLRDGGAVARSQRIEIVAGGAAPATRIVVRTDQAVRAGQRASVRAWPALAAGDAVASITWAQIEGPAIEIDTSEPARAIFTAPAVASDTLLRLRATLRSANGAVARDEVLVVIEGQPPPPAGQLFDTFKASRVYPYRPAGAFADRLVRCVYDPALYYLADNNTNLCTLGELPLLAQRTGGATPTVEQVMERVLVSHDWMGARFEEFLRRQRNDDLLRLFGSVNAIVLGAHVRPSFYWSATGAIYLDADNLWLEPAERDVVSEVPDFRSGFDRELNYTAPWRYVNGNLPALRFYDPARRDGRALSDLDYELGSLMFHELAHANDFFPSSMRANASTGVPVFRAVPLVQPSDRLAHELPLLSQPMFSLARVKFFGVEANAEQRSYTPRQVADFFRADGASDEYGFAVPPGASTSPREDLAMLFEEFMMLHHHGLRRDVAMTNKFLPGMTGSDLIVAWGQRGRIGETQVKPRLALVLDEIAPWIGARAADGVPPPIALREGASWTANLNPADADVTRMDARQRAAGDDARAIERMLRLREQRVPPAPGR